MKRVFLLFLMSLTWLTIAHAASPYSEFNPDYTQSLLVATQAGSIQEVFLPLNEYLSGIDLWVSNADSAGPATISLYTESGSLLASRTVTIPVIADSQTGTRFHVNFPAQLAVTGGTPYVIGIESALPALRLYYADANPLLAHNGQAPLSYTTGIARLNNTDTGFSFSYALYESTESAPPVLGPVTVTQPQVGQVLMHLSANEPIDYTLHYAPAGQAATDTPFTGTYTSCITGVSICTIDLSVAPATLYNFTLTVKDTWGNQSTFSGTFTSLDYGQTPPPTPDASPTPTSQTSPTPSVAPVAISNLRVTTVLAHSVSIAWTTNVAANGTVVVQLTPILITAGGNSDATLELEHLITIDSLTADTYYQATITTSAAAQNTAVGTVTFLTPKGTPSTTPLPNPSPTPSTPTTPAPSVSSGPGPGGATTVSWPTPTHGEPAQGYRIDVFDQNNVLIKSIAVAAGQHSTTVPGLSPGQHKVIVYEKTPEGAYQKVTAPAYVAVKKKSLLERALINAPYILGAFILGLALVVGIVAWRNHKNPPPPPVTPPLPPIPGTTGVL